MARIVYGGSLQEVTADFWRHYDSIDKFLEHEMQETNEENGPLLVVVSEPTDPFDNTGFNVDGYIQIEEGEKIIFSDDGISRFTNDSWIVGYVEDKKGNKNYFVINDEPYELDSEDLEDDDNKPHIPELKKLLNITDDKFIIVCHQ